MRRPYIPLVRCPYVPPPDSLCGQWYPVGHISARRVYPGAADRSVRRSLDRGGPRMGLKHPKQVRRGSANLAVEPLFSLEGAIPRHEIGDGEIAPEIAFQIIHDELMLDGNARLNVATFVTTWMEPQAERLMAECADK